MKSLSSLTEIKTLILFPKNLAPGIWKNVGSQVEGEILDPFQVYD